MTVHVHGYGIVAFDGQHRVDKVKVGEGLTQDAVTTLQQQVSHHLQQGKAAKVAIICMPHTLAAVLAACVKGLHYCASSI